MGKNANNFYGSVDGEPRKDGLQQAPSDTHRQGIKPTLPPSAHASNPALAENARLPPTSHVKFHSHNNTTLHITKHRPRLTLPRYLLKPSRSHRCHQCHAPEGSCACNPPHTHPHYLTNTQNAHTRRTFTINLFSLTDKTTDTAYTQVTNNQITDNE